MGILETLVKEDQGVEGFGKWLRGSRNDSLVIDSEKQIFFWNSKDIAGGPLTYLIKVRKMSLNNAKKYLKELHVCDDIIVYNTKARGNVVVYPKLVNIFWERGLNNRDYWYRRCLTDDIINRFQLGFNNDWYLIPFFINGNFRNFQCRKDMPEKRMRHWYKGIGPLLFNLDILKITNKIIITEGPVDAILLNQFGLPTISHNSGAEGWQREWFKYFINQKEVYYVGDNDFPGVIGAIKVAKNLGVYKTRIYTFSNFPEKYDVVDFFRNGGSIDEFKNLIYYKSKYCWEVDNA